MQKFCNDMETTPVGVIVGLFSAISQKLPAFNEWDSRKHHNLLNSNPAVCDAMTEVRDHVTRYGILVLTDPWLQFLKLTCLQTLTSGPGPVLPSTGKTSTACRTSLSRNWSSEQTNTIPSAYLHHLFFLFCCVISSDSTFIRQH